MIPLKLQLKNFLSYGPQLQTIDFTPYPLICLSGKNGHGKSALLDAITWAIWGQARKTSNTSKPDAGLLHLGQTTMLVILDFECNRQRYRVKREYFKTYGKPLAQLEFGIFKEDNITLVPLTDKTIRKTQEKVIKTINLDYDAFANTAFLRQGHSNEFSQKSPKDRKAILGRILGLDQYEVVRKLAMEKVRQAVNKKNTLSTFHEKMLGQLAKKTQITQSKKELLEKENLLLAITKKLTKEATDLQAQEKAIQQEQKQSEILMLTLGQQQKELTNAIKQLLETKTLWKKVHHEKICAKKYPELLEKKAKLTTQLALHHKKLEQFLQTKNDYLQKKEKLQLLETNHAKKMAIQQSEIAIVIQNHEMRQQFLEKQIKTIQIKLIEQNAELVEKKVKLEKTIAESTDLQKKTMAITGIEIQFEKRKEAYQRWIANGKYTHEQLAQLGQKKELVTNENAPCCPLCEQNLSASRKRFLQDKFTGNTKVLLHKYTRLQKLISRIKAILVEQHKKLETCRQDKQKINELNLCVIQLKEQEIMLQKNILQKQNELQLLSKQLVENNKALASKKKKAEKQQHDELIKNENYLKVELRVKQYKELLQKETFDKKVIVSTKLELEAIEKQIANQQSLQDKIIQQPMRRNTIKNLCKTLKEQKRSLLINQKKATHYNQLEKKESALQKERLALAQENKQHTMQKELMVQEKAILNAQEKQLEAKQKEQKQLQKDLNQLEKTAEEYQIIATATSKDGVQALLIEDAIPEIEHEANELLSKLTDGQAHIIIESLRDLKKGGTRETLDIHISDTSGIRPYELFSGGEAFRIDFALRIAISKLLARRAGTALQTLIIDEGFGSQDEQGLSLIMDAIYKIQDDFSKVIIVSHLSAMKDQFPVHFAVYKNANGSHVSIIEQG